MNKYRKNSLQTNRNKHIQLIAIATLVFVLTASWAMFPFSASAAIWTYDSWGYSLVDSDGITLTGWQFFNGNWYYLNEDGIMQTGWIAVGNRWYYFNPDGAMHKGWLSYGYDWYFFHPEDGSMVTGWQQILGEWYYFDAEGRMATGWLASGDRWYYMSESGTMLTGWQQINGEWHYFVPDTGYMATDCWVSDETGKACYLDESGIWVPGGLSWIGDSLTAFENSQIALTAFFYSPDVEAQGSKCIYTSLDGNPSGLSIAGNMAAQGRIQNYLVFALGTNRDTNYPYVSTTQKINELISIVGNDTKIVLVTAYSTNDWCTDYYYGCINDELRTIAANNPNVAVADWASICDPDTDLMDWAHPNINGAYKYMRLIRDTLVYYFGPQ